MKKIILMISIFFIGLNIVNANEIVKFAACSDGDTFNAYIDGEKERVRLLAVDAPETEKQNKEAEYYANEASEYTCKKIKKAKKIVLEYDPNSDKLDKYNRVLAWVFLDGELLQSALVENGYAKVAYLYDDYKYADILIQEQELASAKGIGIWDNQAKEAYEANHDEVNNNDEKYENYEVLIITIGLLIMTFLASRIRK